MIIHNYTVFMVKTEILPTFSITWLFMHFTYLTTPLVISGISPPGHTPYNPAVPPAASDLL